MAQSSNNNPAQNQAASSPAQPGMSPLPTSISKAQSSPPTAQPMPSTSNPAGSTSTTQTKPVSSNGNSTPPPPLMQAQPTPSPHPEQASIKPPPVNKRAAPMGLVIGILLLVLLVPLVAGVYLWYSGQDPDATPIADVPTETEDSPLTRRSPSPSPRATAETREITNTDSPGSTVSGSLAQTLPSPEPTPLTTPLSFGLASPTPSPTTATTVNQIDLPEAGNPLHSLVLVSLGAVVVLLGFVFVSV